jgi:predicted unusual protein kinase regulating ubiquinone biosynthesis (AarF/ABC1/UbiB family)
LLPKLPALDSVFAEIKAMLKQELDYEQERKELEFFRTALANDDRFVLPEPIPTYSTKKILAMTYLPGTRVDSAEVKNLSQSRRNTLGEAALSLYLDELFIHQAVQTDPHFGNYRIQINSNGGDKIVLYDFGAVRRLEKDFIEKYRELLASVFHHDKERFFSAAEKLKMLERSDPEDLIDLFFQLCCLIVEPFTNKSFDWGKDDLPKRVTKTTAEMFKGYQLRTPPRELVFLDRKMTGMYVFLSVLGVQIDASKILQKHLKD